MPRAPLFLALALPLLGCAANPAPSAPESHGAFIGYLTPHRGTKPGETFTVTTDGIVSPSVQISRAPSGFQGTLRRAPISLHVEGDDILGEIGAHRILLHVDRSDTEWRVSGIWADRAAEYRVARTPGKCDPRQLTVTVEGKPDPCEVAQTVHAMADRLAENEALALLTVMLLATPNTVAREVLPGAPPPSRTPPGSSDAPVPRGRSSGGRTGRSSS